jgi:hypothetical protein
VAGGRWKIAPPAPRVVLRRRQPDAGGPGPGATPDGNGEHPAAIANPDGSVSLFYLRNTNFKMLMASAADGLTFTSEYDTGISNANDPDLVPQPDGSVRMYYNWGDDASGAIYSALYVGAPFAP